jgi:hypothetical protein
MTKTGEAYTTARAQIIRKSDHETNGSSPVAAPVAAPARPDYATLAGTSDAVLKEKTGCNWERWVWTLDALGAAAMPHRDIAALVNTKYKIDGWWAQTVTVGYERIKGLRAIGQRRDGTFEASKSRTFHVPVATLFEAWADAGTRRRWLKDPAIKVRTARAPKSMRLDGPDGTIIAVDFSSKGKDKSVVALAHTKLPDKATADRFKLYWSEKLDALGVALAKA